MLKVLSKEKFLSAFKWAIIAQGAAKLWHVIVGGLKKILALAESNSFLLSKRQTHKLRLQQWWEGGSWNVNITKQIWQILLSKAVNQGEGGSKRGQKICNRIFWMTPKAIFSNFDESKFCRPLNYDNKNSLLESPKSYLFGQYLKKSTAALLT